MDDKIPVQQVDYTKLKARLEQDGQILEWKHPASKKKVAH